MPSLPRSRATYIALALALIAVGLVTRQPVLASPAAKYAGSIIWGSMVYFVVAAVRPTQAVAVRIVVAGCLAAAVEFSQLWHPAWLDEFRRTAAGVLLLGRFFSWWDIVCYGFGIAGAALFDRTIVCGPTPNARNSMSFWKSLFGGGGAAAGDNKPSEPVDYNGFTIRATPFKDGGQYQTAGVIEKEIAGVRREHKFIRADRHVSYDDAAAFSLSKARQMIDQMGDRMFDLG